MQNIFINCTDKALPLMPANNKNDWNRQRPGITRKKAKQTQRLCTVHVGYSKYQGLSSFLQGLIMKLRCLWLT